MKYTYNLLIINGNRIIFPQKHSKLGYLCSKKLGKINTDILCKNDD